MDKTFKNTITNEKMNIVNYILPIFSKFGEPTITNEGYCNFDLEYNNVIIEVKQRDVEYDEMIMEIKKYHYMLKNNKKIFYINFYSNKNYYDIWNITKMVNILGSSIKTGDRLIPKTTCGSKEKIMKRVMYLPKTYNSFHHRVYIKSL